MQEDACHLYGTLCGHLHCMAGELPAEFTVVRVCSRHIAATHNSTGLSCQTISNPSCRGQHVELQLLKSEEGLQIVRTERADIA